MESPKQQRTTVDEIVDKEDRETDEVYKVYKD